jgi:hypothetical protein
MRIAGVLAEIQTWHLPNINQKSFRASQHRSVRSSGQRTSCSQHEGSQKPRKDMSTAVGSVSTQIVIHRDRHLWTGRRWSLLCYSRLRAYVCRRLAGTLRESWSLRFSTSAASTPLTHVSYTASVWASYYSHVHVFHRYECISRNTLCGSPPWNPPTRCEHR